VIYLSKRVCIIKTRKNNGIQRSHENTPSLEKTNEKNESKEISFPKEKKKKNTRYPIRTPKEKRKAKLMPTVFRSKESCRERKLITYTRQMAYNEKIPGAPKDKISKSMVIGITRKKT